jgi:glycine dehydrogenase subunit 1
MQKPHYAMKRPGELGGVNAPSFDAVHFKEFTVDFNKSKKSVEHINKELLQHGIQGGKNLKGMFPELNETALYCVTEVHSQQDIDRLVETLEEVL